MPSLTATPVILLGSWKFRHDAPFDGEDPPLLAIEPGSLMHGAATSVADLRGARRVLARWRGDGSASGIEAAAPAEASLDCGNLHGRRIPLAIAVLSDARVEITHLLTRLDTHRATFVRPPRAIAQPADRDALPDALLRAFRANRLAVNNWECRYAFSDTVFEERFEFANLDAPRALGEAWYGALDSGRAAPFIAQSGDEFRLLDHDVTACREIPAGEVWVEHWSRKRKEESELSLAQVFRAAPDARQPASRVEARIEAPFAESLASVVDRPLQAIGGYRRVAFSTECESTRSGHVFSVVFETCVASHANEAGHAPPARTSRGSLRFQKTRGEANPATIADELAELSAIVHRFLHSRHLVAEPARPMLAFLQAAGADRSIP
ncbi:hypothetical protein [Burkholderia plantarii]|uniref:hypothetical protein n=1 Tax=Burkholderia plantarii TaxID=41899 RepID=UPI0018DE1013|nr:hypothetical protein [Burkholderia plantarii]MBI0330013.1 hypothetical protein [Burkholderia plantarii]